MKGSGKSRLLSDLFIPHHPRVITLDPNGEVCDSDPDAIPVVGWPALMDMLRMVAGEPDGASWHLGVSLDDDDVPRLFDLMAPESVMRSTGLSRALGGVAFACGECDTIAPNGRADRRVRSAWKRSRHHLLSLYMATQRPAETDRIVSSQADHLIAFRLVEPRDLAYLADATSRDVAREVAQLPPYWCAWYDRARTDVAILDASRRVVRRLPLFGTKEIA